MKKLILGMTLLLVSCSALNQKVGLPDDNAIEQIVEGIIKMETGLNIDLTPDDNAAGR